jgi:hypothetical protein
MPFSGVGEVASSQAPLPLHLRARAPVTGELQLSALSPRAAPTVIGLGTLRLLQRCSRRVPFQSIAAHAHVMPNNGTIV